tara:strand:+ start:5826 stop:6449 length:624 start_codon:yes stop_codon:yes gene_type:complete
MLFDRRQMIGGLMGAACCPPLVSTKALAIPADGEFHIICGMQHTATGMGIQKPRTPAPEAKRVIGWISDAIGVRPTFEVLEADFSRGGIAAAATRGDHRYVLYDAKWFTFEKNTVGWYALFVLAHEIGHHIHGHTHGFKPSRHQGELDADRFGGWIVARLGGRLDQALSFMPYLSETGSKSHPPRGKRIEATIAGWKSGSGTEGPHE